MTSADSNDLQNTLETELSSEDEQLKGATGGSFLLGTAVTTGLTGQSMVDKFIANEKLYDAASDTLENQKQRLENAQHIQQLNDELEAALMGQLGGSRHAFDELKARTKQRLSQSDH